MIGEKTQLAAIRGFLPLDVVTALFVCYFKTAVCGAARRARADFFGFLCPRWARTQSAAARPRADAAAAAQTGLKFQAKKRLFCFAASSLQIWGAVPYVGTNSQRCGAGACRGLHGGPRGGAYFTGTDRLRGEKTKTEQNIITVTPIPTVRRRHDVHIGLATALLGNVHHILR